jgi:cell division protein FtsZ
MEEAFIIEEADTNEQLISKEVRVNGAKIIVIGVGGGGSNMINHMIDEGVSGIQLMVANTDAQALDQSRAHGKIQLGAKLTKGLGAGMKPDIGRESAIESTDNIREAVADADIVFVSAGLGGGTGTGAAPVIAQIAKESGALTISVVTRPFKFERKKRMKLAQDGLEELKRSSDSIIVIPNEKLLSIVDKNLGIKDSFKIVDSVLARAVQGTSGVVLSSGENDINLDFADLQTVMGHHGMALMGMGEFQGQNAAYEAIKSAIESPLLEDVSINGALGVLINFNINPNYPLVEINDAMDIVEDSADEDAEVMFGTNTDASMPIDLVRVTIIATGFEQQAANTTRRRTAMEMGDSLHEDMVKTKGHFQIPSKSTLQRVSGSDIDLSDMPEDMLDLPTYVRRQKD